MGNRISTSLIYNSYHDKINYRFIVLCFYMKACQGTHTIMLVQAGMQANHLASTTDHAGNITNFLKTQKR